MVSFVVYGKASPAGSKRAFVKGGRAVVVDDAKGSTGALAASASVSGGAAAEA